MTIPDTWNNLDSFVTWYIENGYPRKPPDPPEIYFTDVGTSVIIFRQDVYQAEFYIGSPFFNTSKHYHPFEQSIIVVGGNGKGRRGEKIDEEPPWVNIDHNQHNQRVDSTLYDYQWHQLSSYNKGLYFFNFQRWPSKEKMSSAIIGYNGDSLGPVHEELMDNFNKK